MKETLSPVPENNVHADPVTEQFVSADRGQMQIPKNMRGVPGFMYHLFTNIERVLLNKKPR